MKRLLTLIFSIAVLAGFAQNPMTTATVHGYVTMAGTNLAVEGHMVKVTLYSYDSTGIAQTVSVYTNNNGWYTFTGSMDGTQGWLEVETEICDNQIEVESFQISINSPNIFTRDFFICDNSGCNADFYYYPLNELTYQFVNLSTQAENMAYYWSFGDGTYSTEYSPVKTYAAPGMYTVNLSISAPDSSCFDNMTMDLFIWSEGCKAFFIYSNDPSTENTIYFADSSSGSPSTWLWEFGDGTTSKEQFPTHTYAEQGFYTVCLTISNDSTNCSSIYCDNVMVGSTSCMAQFTYWPAADSMYTPNAIQFYDLSYGTPTQWSWSFGDGTGSQEQYPVHVYQEPGIYQVCLTIGGNDCESTWCMEVYVDQTWPMCYNYFTYSNAGNMVSFEGFCSSNLPTTYLWDFGDGISMEGNPVAHTYAGPGIYYVTLESWDSVGCRTFSSQEILVGDTIMYNQVYGQVFEGNFPLTSGFVMIFSVEDATNYYPYFDLAMVDENGVYSFPMVPQGNYNLLAVPTDGGQYLPTYFESTLFWQEADTVVAGEYMVPLNIQLQTIQGNTNAGSGTISGHINQAGVRDGFVGQIIMYLTDNDHKILEFTQVNTAGDFSFTNLANGNYFIKAELPGVYSEYIPVTLGQGQTEVTVQMTFTGNSILGRPETISTTADVTIYPNPATEVARVVFKLEERGMVNISLLDLAGRIVSAQQVNAQAGTSKAELNLGNVGKGIYMLRVQFSDGSEFSSKLAKE